MPYFFNATSQSLYFSSSDNIYDIPAFAITPVNYGTVGFEIAGDPSSDFANILFMPLSRRLPVTITLPFTDIWDQGSVAVQSNGNVLYGLISQMPGDLATIISVLITPSGTYSIHSAIIGSGNETVTGVTSNGVIRVHDDVSGDFYVNSLASTVTPSNPNFTPLTPQTDALLGASLVTTFADPNDPSTESDYLTWTYKGATNLLFDNLTADPTFTYHLVGFVGDGSNIEAIVSDGLGLMLLRTVGKLFTTAADNWDFNALTPGNSLAGDDNALAGNDIVNLPNDLQAWNLTSGFHGGDGNDTIYAGGVSTTIYGDVGADTIVGGAGDDVLYGGSGLADDHAPDDLTGGGGTNIFHVGNGDTIEDAVGGDTIVLPGINATISARNSDGSFDVTVQEANGSGGYAAAVVHVISGSSYIGFLKSEAGGQTVLSVVDSPLPFSNPAPSADFSGDGLSDVLFHARSGTFASWQVSGTLLSGGGNIGNPGGNWTLATTADLNGDGFTDLVFRGHDGTLASWQLGGTAITGGGSIGNPGAACALVGSGDFNGDHRADMLFLNTVTGGYATWNLSSGSAIVGGGTIGAPGPSYVFKAAADFDGDGKSDILFQNANGTYAIWTLNDTAITGGGNIGNPGAGWFFKGTGDFNSDGKADLLFENANGTYATWDLNGTSDCRRRHSRQSRLGVYAGGHRRLQRRWLFGHPVPQDRWHAGDVDAARHHDHRRRHARQSGLVVRRRHGSRCQCVRQSRLPGQRHQHRRDLAGGEQHRRRRRHARDARLAMERGGHR